MDVHENGCDKVAQDEGTSVVSRILPYVRACKNESDEIDTSHDEVEFAVESCQ